MTLHKNHAIDHAKTAIVASRYDETAGHYDARYADVQAEKFELLVAGSFPRAMVNSIKTGDGISEDNGAIVDLGAGTGLFSRFLHERYPRCHMPVAGIDVSWNMLLEARKHAPRARHAPVQAGVDAVPLRPGIAPWVVSFSTLQNLDDMQRERFLQEVSRVSRPGRVVFSFSFLNKPPLDAMVPAIVARLQEIFDEVSVLPARAGMEDTCIACRSGW